MAYREESSRVFVGNLPMDIKEREIDDLFYKYGRIRSIDLKVGPRPPAFAFVEFSDPRDAQDAIRGRDGYDFAGERLRVELSHGPRSGRGGGGGPMGGRSLGPSPHGPSRRTGYRVLVSGLPMSCSWQDLKDHMRRAGDVTFSQVMRDGRNGVLGIIDYATMDDMENALRKLDGSDFRNPYDTARIRVKEDRDGVEGGAAGGGGGSRRSRSRSRSKSRSRSRSRSPKREASRSRSRSRSRSPAAREASRSRSRSRSKSPRREASRSRSTARSASRSPSRD